MKRIYFVLVFFTPIFLFAQVCPDLHLKCCHSDQQGFAMHEISNTFKLNNDSNIELELEIFNGKDYFISICGDDNLGNILNLKILNNNNDIIFDNSKENYILQFDFSCIQTQSIKLIVEIPGLNGVNISGCLGVLVEHKLSAKTGF